MKKNDRSWPNRNRLTIRNGDGSVSQPTDLRWADALCLLADYEDTGYSPKKVLEAKEIVEYLKKSGTLSIIKAFAAKERNRVIVLPCVVGDVLCDKSGSYYEVLAIYLLASDVATFECKKYESRRDDPNNRVYFTTYDFNETVFLVEQATYPDTERTKHG